MFYFDPTITLKEEIVDNKGKIVIPKKTVYNPLDNHSLKNPLLFLNGEDQGHISWAMEQEEEAVWVLTKGNPFELGEQLGKSIKFDQGGVIAKRMAIKYIPAKVVQEGKKLKIEESSLRKKNG